MQAFLAMDLAWDLGATLLHSLWQIAFLAAGLWGLRVLVHRASPRFHYAVASLALVAALAWPVGTFLCLRGHRRASARQVQVHQVPAVRQPLMEERLYSALDPLSKVLPWLGVLWGLGALGCGGRMAGGFIALRNLDGKSREASVELEHCMHALAHRLGMRPPRLRLVSGVGPCSYGLFRRVILLPLACLGGLDRTALEAILAHELAHLRRMDFLANGLQSLLEILLFHHPLAWWISSVVRFERERCCDEIAATACGGARSVAAALLQLDDLRPPRLALGAQGAALSLRIRSLMGVPTRPNPLSMLGAVALLGGLLLLGSSLLRAEGSVIIIRAPARLVALADQEAKAQGVDPHLVRAVIQCESHYNPAAVSRMGAVGLMQLIPETAQRMGGGDMREPAINVKAGTRYLKFLLDRYRGNTALAVMAYNAGEDAVDRCEGIAPTEESRSYALAVLDLYRRKAVESDQ